MTPSRPATRACPACTNAPWPTFLGAPPSFRASSAATVSPPFYEVNIWMWRYGRGRTRMVSIAEAERIRAERLSESRLRGTETRKHSSEAAAAARGVRAAAENHLGYYDMISYMISQTLSYHMVSQTLSYPRSPLPPRPPPPAPHAPLLALHRRLRRQRHAGRDRAA